MTTARRVPPRAQRGAVLLFAMIALVILLIGTVALMRSMNNSLFTAGNFGFKRDLTNQSERAINAVLDAVQTGALASAVVREANVSASNYSASVLPVNEQGVPTALLTDAGFAAVGVASNDITLADMGVTVRYLVDRLCVAAGPVNQDGCTVDPNLAPSGKSASERLGPDDDSVQVVYRVSVRVTGPRRTQSFFQTTFTI